jgi:hypothetical protein
VPLGTAEGKLRAAKLEFRDARVFDPKAAYGKRSDHV